MTKKIIVKAPGRINLIGEHIDYNGGFVLPASINKKIVLELTYIDGNNCIIHSKTLGKKFSINVLKLKKSKTHWENYIIGTLHVLTTSEKYKIGGFNCEIYGDLPLGSGMSSSSALVSGLVVGLDNIFNLNLSKNDIINIVSKVEREFIGLRGGIMDQFAIVNGKKNNLILLNCSDRSFSYINTNFNKYKLLILNTNIKHNLAKSEYNDRVNECTIALNIIKKKYSRYDFLTQIDENILVEFKDTLSKKVYDRALFVIQENKRTLSSVQKIKENKLLELGDLMYQSHEGLKNLYNVSCEELDFLVDYTQDFEQVIGSRMMGGGFGGCTINLIDEFFIEEFTELVTNSYKNRFGLILTYDIVKIGDGIVVKK